MRENCEFIRLWLTGRGLVVRPLCLFTGLPNETGDDVFLDVITTLKLLTNRAYESESGLNVFSFVTVFVLFCLLIF